MAEIGYLVGSLSQDSINRRLAMALCRVAPAGVVLRELRIDDLPLYNPDTDAAFAPAGRRLKDDIASVDAVVLLTPEYNRSVPAVLKNAVDYASRPWGESSWPDRPVAVAGVGLNGAGTAVAQAHLRAVLGACGAQVLGGPELCLAWTDGLIDDDGCPAPHLASRLRAFLDAVIAHAERHRAVPSAAWPLSS
jgi:chromate reductase